MALKAVSIWGYSKALSPPLGVGLANSHSTPIGNQRYDFDKCRRWESCCLGVLAQTATTAVEDEEPNVPPLIDSSGAADGVHQIHKDIIQLPSELYDITPLPSPPPTHTHHNFFYLCLTGIPRILELC